MVSSATKILDSGYTIALAKAYSGSNAYHWYWWVYPDDTDWYWSDKHGNLPRSVVFNFSFRKESSRTPVTPSIHKGSFVSKFNGSEYIVSITNTWAKDFSMCALMSIYDMYADETAYHGNIELITVDVANIGGDGTFDLILFDGSVEIDRVQDQTVLADSSTRETLQFIMLNHPMTLTMKLVDNYNGDVVDEKQHIINLHDPCEGVICEPECFDVDLYNTVCESGVCVQENIINVNDTTCGYVQPEHPNIPDMIMDNKEIVVIGIIAGALVLNSI